MASLSMGDLIQFDDSGTWTVLATTSIDNRWGSGSIRVHMRREGDDKFASREWTPGFQVVVVGYASVMRKCQPDIGDVVSFTVDEIEQRGRVISRWTLPTEGLVLEVIVGSKQVKVYARDAAIIEMAPFPTDIRF